MRIERYEQMLFSSSGEEIKTFPGIVKGVESLKKMGIDKICKLSTFGRECEELGYSVDKLMELVRLVNKKASLERQVSTLESRITALKQGVKCVGSERLAMIARNRGLSVAYEIIKSRITTMACFYCGKPIVVPVPSIWQLNDSMKRGLVYPTKCYYCGYINQVSAHDILASIAWKILTASSAIV